MTGDRAERRGSAILDDVQEGCFWCVGGGRGEHETSPLVDDRSTGWPRQRSEIEGQ
jgi:hypothetical protein